MASPNAHGQAITKTEIKNESDVTNPASKMYHASPVTTAIPITIGTKYPATVSAIREIGAFDP